MSILYLPVRAVLFRLDPEVAHAGTLRLLSIFNRAPAAAPVLRRILGADDPRLAVEAFGLRFPNQVGLAAGLDKNATALAGWSALGFGHVEVGTVTPDPQPGNPLPRVFRLVRDEALINRMGFPNDGADRIAVRLRAGRRNRSAMRVGGNVGKGIATPIEDAPADYAAAARLIAPHVDYLAANISSPNTPGLRSLQAPEQVQRIVSLLTAQNSIPVLVKLAPDLPLASLPEIVAAARAAGASGFVATNTTTDHTGLTATERHASEPGGLSGPPLRQKALTFVEHLAKAAGHSLPVIAAGGISTPAHVQDALSAGARLVQVYTALVYQGPLLPRRLARATLASR